MSDQELVERESPKSWAIAWSYWMGTGLFGGHRFYLGRYKTGALQLVAFFGSLLVLLLLPIRWDYRGYPLAGLMFFGTSVIALLDALLLGIGVLSDEQRLRLKPRVGDVRRLWCGLGLGLILMLLQFFCFTAMLGGLREALKLNQNILMPFNVLIPLWVVASWGVGYLCLCLRDLRDESHTRALGVCAVFGLVGSLLVYGWWLLVLIGTDLSVSYTHMNQLGPLQLLGDVIHNKVWECLRFLISVACALFFSSTVLLLSYFFRLVRLEATTFSWRSSAVGWCVAFLWCVGAWICGATWLLVVLVAIVLSLITAFLGLRDEEDVSALLSSLPLLFVSCSGVVWAFAHLHAFAAEVKSLWQKPYVLQAQVEVPWEKPLLSADSVLLAAFCIIALLALLWRDREREVRCSHVAALLALSVSFGSVFMTVRTAPDSIIWNFSYNIALPTQSIANSYLVGIGVSRDSIPVISVDSLRAFVYVHEKKPPTLFERFLWMAPREVMILNGLGGTNYQIHKSLPMRKALQLFPNAGIRIRRGKEVGKKHLVMMISPTLKRSAFCQAMREFAQFPYKRITLVIPEFVRWRLPSKTITLMKRTYEIRWRWSKIPVQSANANMKDVLYSRRMRLLARAQKAELRMCQHPLARTRQRAFQPSR